MGELEALISSEIKSKSSPPWMPLLGGPIVDAEWLRLKKQLGVTTSDYSTCRILEAIKNGSKRAESRPRGKSIQLGQIHILLETVPESFLEEYKTRGFKFYDATAVLNGSPILKIIKDALQLIQIVPTLFGTIAVIVRSMHLLRPEDEHHDVSFSLPDIPFSVFVSVPGKRNHDTTLRVAEAIIHEAMHLQLTLIEHAIPMVTESNSRFLSPWRNAERSASGILHAVYVFAVIDSWLNLLPATLINTYAQKRKREIADQMQQIKSFPASAELTPYGRLLFLRLLSSFQ